MGTEQIISIRGAVRKELERVVRDAKSVAGAVVRRLDGRLHLDFTTDEAFGQELVRSPELARSMHGQAEFAAPWNQGARQDRLSIYGFPVDDSRYAILLHSRPRLFPARRPHWNTRELRAALAREAYLSLERLHEVARVSIAALLDPTEGKNPFQVTLEVLVKLFECRLGTIWEYHDNSKFQAPSYLTLEGAAGHELSRYKRHCLREGQGLVWQVLRQPEPCVMIPSVRECDLANHEVYDDYKDKSVLLIKLKVVKEVFGVTCLAGIAPGSLASVQRVLEIFEKAAILEIQHKRVERRNRVLAKVADVVPTVGESLRDSCMATAENVRALINAQGVSVFLKPGLDPASRKLVLQAASTHPDCKPTEKLRLFNEKGIAVEYDLDEKSLTGAIANRKEALICNAVSEEERNSKKFRETTETDNDTWMGVPILDSKKNCIGVIRCTGKLRNLGDAVADYVFDAFDVFVLRHFAEIVSPILATINTVARLDSLNRKLEHDERFRRHEINAPLAIIAANASFVLKYLNDPGVTSKERRLREILSDIDMCAFLLKDVTIPSKERFARSLQYISPTALLLQLKNFLRRIIESRSDPAVGSIASATDSNFEIAEFMSVNVRGAAPKTLLNKHLIQRAFFNLGINAVKYGVPKGSLVITLGQSPQADEIVVEFSDDGVGIDAEDAPFIFTEGFRGRNVRDTHPGMGLGLTIARSVAEAHGGNIELTSARKPTTFRVTLPVVAPAPGEAVMPEHASVLRMDMPKRIN